MALPERHEAPGAHEVPRVTGPEPSVRIESVETVADDWFTLRSYRLAATRRDGSAQHLTRLSFDRGDRAAVLLHSRTSGTVVLTGQFRLPALLHDAPGGELLEAPGGLLDDADAREAVRREAEEETGYRVGDLCPAFVTYLAPQLSSERTHLFTAEYDPALRTGPGGGVAEEGEDIRVLELTLEEAIEKVTRQPAADAKTLLLLLHARDRGLCDPPGNPLPAVPEKKGRPS
ncbi:NUDIX domain-containing protein [Streptomyces cinnamoneus]|uniref:NUDIX domain-containing protein n=1 Tax=Streptomyces cinnamoneus TaxID=53446 RepID=UPI0033C359F7